MDSYLFLRASKARGERKTVFNLVLAKISEATLRKIERATEYKSDGLLLH